MFIMFCFILYTFTTKDAITIETYCNSRLTFTLKSSDTFDINFKSYMLLTIRLDTLIAFSFITSKTINCFNIFFA